MENKKIKIRLQLNGESNYLDNVEDLEVSGMIDCEYEFDLDIEEGKLGILEDMLDKIIDTSKDNNFFNWHIVIKN